MEILTEFQKKNNLSLALGFFDGIHLGHQKVIESAVSFAKKNHIKSAVISYKEHPTCILHNRKPAYILPLNEKIKFFESFGLDYFYILDFDKAFSEMSREDYFDFLCKMTSPKAIITGFNHYFAKNKSGDTEFLKSVCDLNNIFYAKVEPVIFEGNVISSSAIRNAVFNADLKLASRMLGYDFFVKNKVIKGNNIGEKLGFKTLNLIYPENIIKLPFGVYYTKAEIGNKQYDSVTNWGVKPTIENTNSPVIETHVFNFDKNCYDEIVKIKFISKIRDEKKFDNKCDLKHQIEKDVEFCKNYKTINK